MIVPSLSTLAVPVATIATPPPVLISLNEKFEKVIVCPETVPVTATVFQVTGRQELHPERRARLSDVRDVMEHPRVERQIHGTGG